MRNTTEKVIETDPQEIEELLQSLVKKNEKPEEAPISKPDTTEEKRRDQRLADEQALARLRAQNFRREQDLLRIARQRQSTLAGNAARLQEAEQALLLDFACGGYGSSVADLVIVPGFKLGTSELSYKQQLIAIRTAESRLNPVFIHLAPVQSDPATSQLLIRLIAQLEALSKAHVALASASIELYRTAL